MIKTVDNKYDGVIVDSTTLPTNISEFKKEIAQLAESLQNKKLLWIKIPIEKSDFIPVLTNIGFEFHHCDERSLMLVKKMAYDSFVPTTKNYIVGVGAIVLNEGQLLVIKDRFSAGYKLPGGHIDRNESIKDALKREVREETGISVEFESIINIGHFRNGQFGESNLYIVCTTKALSKDITINDSSEVAEACWIDPVDFLNSADVNSYNKSVVEAAINNKELKLIEQHIKLRVPGGEVFF
jgi:ADP-ribose pyrophosphatase